MSCMNPDRATLNEKANVLDEELSASGLDQALQNAFEAGMEIDEIMYTLFSHTERIVRRSIVQNQLKKAANKEKVEK